MPFPSRLAAQRRVRLHRGPKKGRWPIRTLPAFPARLLACPDHPANRSTSRRFVRTLDPGLLANATPALRSRIALIAGRRSGIADPMSPLNTLDTRGAEMFPGGHQVLTLVILSLCGFGRNGTSGPTVGEALAWRI